MSPWLIVSKVVTPKGPLVKIVLTIQGARTLIEDLAPASADARGFIGDFKENLRLAVKSTDPGMPINILLNVDSACFLCREFSEASVQGHAKVLLDAVKRTANQLDTRLS